MTRYLEIARSIAAQVQSGELAAGDELPSVRGLARARDTTATTVSRAYHELAQAGVVSRGDRRRARVRPGASIGARRLLGTEGVLRLAGSDDPALDVVVRSAGPAVAIVPGSRGSFQGLTALWRGTADAAAIHLLHRSGAYNAPYASALLRGRRPLLVHLWRREQGLLVGPGNPRGITTISDLAGVRVVKREFGAGTRVLLDRMLLEAGIEPDSVPGPETDSHLAVALAVAAGVAEAGIGVRAAAAALGLDFVPLVWEQYDIAMPGDALAAAGPLLDALRDAEVRRGIEALGGYDAGRAGDLRELADGGATEAADLRA
ncbi:MAG: substrate-binding domain-containing protein [Solirubrobacteraceae bacterium]